MTASTLPAAANPADGPCAGQMARLRIALLDCVTPEDIVTITRAMIKKAADGSLGAAKLVFSYVLGKPEPASDPNRSVAEPVKPQPERKITPEQEKSVEAMYQALYGETPPSPNGDKRQRRDSGPLSALANLAKK